MLLHASLTARLGLLLLELLLELLLRLLLPPHLGGTVHLDVLNDQVVGVKTFVLGVALGILEHVEQELCRLHGPPALSGSMDLVGLGMSSNSSHETPERDDLLLGDDVLEVLGGPVKRHSLDGLGCLPCVLEVIPQVGPC